MVIVTYIALGLIVIAVLVAIISVIAAMIKPDNGYGVIAIFAIVFAIPLGMVVSLKSDCPSCDQQYIVISAPDFCGRCGFDFKCDSEIECSCGETYSYEKGYQFCAECGAKLIYSTETQKESENNATENHG